MRIVFRVEGYKGFRRYLSKLTKKAIIVEAVKWQLDNLETESLSYIKSNRRTATIELSDDELAQLKTLADFMDVTLAQASLISVRNFLAANDEGRVSYLSDAEILEVPQSFMIAVPQEVLDAMNNHKGTVCSKIRDALRYCAEAEMLPPLQGKQVDVKRIPLRTNLPDPSDRMLLESMMLRHMDNRGRILTRCLMLKYLPEYMVEDDLEIF